MIIYWEVVYLCKNVFQQKFLCIKVIVLKKPHCCCEALKKFLVSITEKIFIKINLRINFYEFFC